MHLQQKDAFSLRERGGAANDCAQVVTNPFVVWLSSTPLASVVYALLRIVDVRGGTEVRPKLSSGSRLDEARYSRY